MDFSELQLESGSFVDERLKAGITDALFSVPLNGNLSYIYILVEHQSTSDRWMPFRLRKYVCMLLDELISTSNPDKLPLVYPIVFYNGREAYCKTQDFLDLFEVSRELADLCLNQPFQLIDLSAYDDQQLKDNVWLNVFHLLMKHIHDTDITKILLDLIPYLSQIEKEAHGIEFIARVIRYILSSSETGDADTIIETTVSGLSKETGAMIMTLAEQLIEKGRQQKEEEMMGLLEKEQKAREKERAGRMVAEERARLARQENARDIAIRMLQNGISPDLVAISTGISLEAVKDLKRKLP